MHILFIPSWYPKDGYDIGGSFFREQAIALKSAGFKIGVITPNLRRLGLANLFGSYSIEKLTNETFPAYRMNGVKFFPFSQKMNLLYWEKLGLILFKKYVQDNGYPDVIHVHSMIYGVSWAKAIEAKHAIPFIITEHSSEFALGNITQELKHYLKAAINKSSACFAVSRKLANLLSLMFTDLEAKFEWRVIHNMFSDSFMKGANEESTPLGVFAFCNIAALVKNKDHETLIKAFHHAFMGNDKVTLSIMGDGPERENLELLVSNLGLSQQISFLGTIARNEVVKNLSKSNGFVLTSKYETFGVSLIEALALGIPSIATQCGGPEDIVREAKDGYLVKVGDIDELSKAMTNLVLNRNLFDRNDIMESCAKRFSSSVYIERYSNEYKSIVKASNDE